MIICVEVTQEGKPCIVVCGKATRLGTSVRLQSWSHARRNSKGNPSVLFQRPIVCFNRYCSSRAPFAATVRIVAQSCAQRDQTNVIQQCASLYGYGHTSWCPQPCGFSTHNDAGLAFLSDFNADDHRMNLRFQVNDK